MIEIMNESEKKLPLTKKEMRGANRTMIKSARQYLNALEWNHVRLGHSNPEQNVIREDLALGAGITWKEQYNRYGI